MRRDAWNDIIVQNHARANALTQLGDPDVRAGGRGKGHHANVRNRLQHAKARARRRRKNPTIGLRQSKVFRTARERCERWTPTPNIHDMALEAHWLVLARYAVQRVRT